MRDYRVDIEGYQEIRQELANCRKYGIDYRAQKGKRAELVNRLHPSRLLLKLSEIIDETPSTRTLRLVSRETSLPPFQAGQYINLCVEIDGVRTSRPYSISSSPRQTAYYDITVRRVANGFVSDYLLDQCQPGDHLESSGPVGHFYYNPLFHGQDLLFLAGGSGVTPFMSMIRETCDLDLQRQIYLLYGSQTADELIFHQELMARAARHQNFHYHPIIEVPSEAFRGPLGRISADMIRETLDGQNFSTVYLCGPSAMYDSILPQLLAIGIPQRRIRREMFSQGSDIGNEPGWPVDIKQENEFCIKMVGGKNIPARAGESLLTALERAGVVVPCNCRSGECSLCRVQLLAGKVFQPQGVLLRATDKKYGYIHSCQAYPLTDLEIRL